ncbi:glycolate oxidase subunit GlcE [Herbaspirillum sp. NPDC087042]|uniref:glycolate oxidase subunit GlcE n=1 Tax=Herbaspirillum sp. NPDC087042 TaxID=3364004 RepID=UPI0037F4D227
MSENDDNMVCEELGGEAFHADRWLAAIQDRIRTAARLGQALAIEGAGTRRGFAGLPVGESLSLQAYRGIVHYEPDDLVITVRAGTPLAEIDRVLAQRGQMLGFEPPAPSGATIGGAVALGWSGPRRPFAGALRDHLLGVRMLDGMGRELRFGGQVVKNVAGFDVARLMAGSLGILGPLLEVSLRVIARAPVELTTLLAVSPRQALQILRSLPSGPGLLSAAVHVDGCLHLRSSGSAHGVRSFLARQGGELLDAQASQSFWQAFTQQTHSFFQPPEGDVGDGAARLRLWRVSVRPGSPEMDLHPVVTSAIDWAGALRWVWAPVTAGQEIAGWARAHGGHASLWAHGTAGERRDGVFGPLPPAVMALHGRLKHVFDPRGIFNVGRMYPPF